MVLGTGYTYPTMYDFQDSFTARNKRYMTMCLVCVPGIRTLQCIMLKIVLLLGIEIHYIVSCLCSRYTYPTMYDAQDSFTARNRGT